VALLVRLSLEFHVSQVQNRRHDLDHHSNMHFIELQLLHRFECLLEVLRIVNTRDRETSSRTQVRVLSRCTQFQRRLQFRIMSTRGIHVAHQLVEDVVVALSGGLLNDSGLLKQVVDRLRANDATR